MTRSVSFGLGCLISMFFGLDICRAGKVTKSKVAIITPDLPGDKERKRHRLEAHGHVFFIDPDQVHAGWYLDSFPSWEPSTFKAFDHFIRPDSVVLDVGSWIGPTVLYEAQRARSVVALEPTKKAFAELAANVQANEEVQRKIVPLNMALGSQEMYANMTNNGDSMDRLKSSSSFLSKSGSTRFNIAADLGPDVHVITIDALRKQQPQLEETSFVKIDTEGYEHVIIPALQGFFKEKKPSVLVSLHPMFISHKMVQGVVDSLKETFPYLYEVDMRTPFNTARESYTYGDHGGADVIGTWSSLSA